MESEEIRIVFVKRGRAALPRRLGGIEASRRRTISESEEISSVAICSGERIGWCVKSVLRPVPIIFIDRAKRDDGDDLHRLIETGHLAELAFGLSCPSSIRPPMAFSWMHTAETCAKSLSIGRSRRGRCRTGRLWLVTPWGMLNR